MDVNNSHIHDAVGNQHIFQNQQTMNHLFIITNNNI